MSIGLEFGAARADGLPGRRGHDHTGITAPDMKQAVDFFVDVLGCQKAMSFGPFSDSKGTFMKDVVDVHPRAVITQITVIRCERLRVNAEPPAQLDNVRNRGASPEKISACRVVGRLQSTLSCRPNSASANVPSCEHSFYSPARLIRNLQREGRGLTRKVQKGGS
jgi:hypothetical protein